jgi:aminopeptidase YwaD
MNGRNELLIAYCLLPTTEEASQKMKKNTALIVLLIFSIQFYPFKASASQQSTDNQFTKTPLLTDKEIVALGSEINGLLAKETVTELARFHRVQASTGFSSAAEFIAAKAKEYGLEQIKIERLVADGEKTYHTLKSTPGWEVESAELWEIDPRKSKIADYEEMRVALADYSQTTNATGTLVDVGNGTSASDYEGKNVKGRIVLAGGNVATAHKMACEERGAAGVLSYQQNQVTGWSGDYVDNVRWGHLSPYNPSNKFAFMISLRRAREFKERLARGEQITLQAKVKAQIKSGNYDVVTAVIRGTDAADEEIVFSCHLCHQKPGANDNASGAAAILEVARTLTALIKRGEIERPRRTIRFVWPPEINGTLAYFAEHPEIVRRMKAAVHCDMVGGNFAITKSVLHVTHTPASLPSAVNIVGDIFANYAITGSAKAAAVADFTDALISPEGSKDSLVADVTAFEMGSDHDVYQEGSFRIPTIYLRDWPDVFIHTNNDKPENIDATKMKRSAFIAGASGYFLAKAGAREASRLADEVFIRAMAQLPKDRARAASLEAIGGETGLEESRNIIARSLERDAEILASAMSLAPNDKNLENKIDGFIEQLSGAWLLLTGQISEQKKGNRVLFTIEAKEQPKDKDKDKAKSRNPKEATRPRTGSFDYSRIVTRKVKGPMNVYYYDYVAARAGEEDLRIVERIGAKPGGDILLYEILNLVDGRRSIQAIRDYLTAAYGTLTVEEVSDYLRLLDKIGVVKIE